MLGVDQVESGYRHVISPASYLRHYFFSVKYSALYISSIVSSVLHVRYYILVIISSCLELTQPSVNIISFEGLEVETTYH